MACGIELGSGRVDLPRAGLIKTAYDKVVRRDDVDSTKMHLSRMCEVSTTLILSPRVLASVNAAWVDEGQLLRGVSADVGRDSCSALAIKSSVRVIDRPRSRA